MTDRRTDRIPMSISRVNTAVLTRDKNDGHVLVIYTFYKLDLDQIRTTFTSVLLRCLQFILTASHKSFATPT